MDTLKKAMAINKYLSLVPINESKGKIIKKKKEKLWKKIRYFFMLIIKNSDDCDNSYNDDRCKSYFLWT